MEGLGRWMLNDLEFIPGRFSERYDDSAPELLLGVTAELDACRTECVVLLVRLTHREGQTGKPANKNLLVLPRIVSDNLNDKLYSSRTQCCLPSGGGPVARPQVSGSGDRCQSPRYHHGAGHSVEPSPRKDTTTGERN